MIPITDMVGPSICTHKLCKQGGPCQPDRWRFGSWVQLISSLFEMKLISCQHRVCNSYSMIVILSYLNLYCNTCMCILKLNHRHPLPTCIFVFLFIFSLLINNNTGSPTNAQTVTWSFKNTFTTRIHTGSLKVDVHKYKYKLEFDNHKLWVGSFRVLGAVQIKVL